MTSSDRFPVPVRSAVKSDFTDWCCQNLSKHALNALTVQASTTTLIVSEDMMMMMMMMQCGDIVRMKSLAWYLLVLLHNAQQLIVFVTWPIFHWLYNGARRGIPPIRSDLLSKSGIELAALIRRRQV